MMRSGFFDVSRYGRERRNPESKTEGKIKSRIHFLLSTWIY